MKTMNISPLSLVLLLTFTLQSAEPSLNHGGEQPAFRSTGSLPIPPQFYPAPSAPSFSSYPPSHRMDYRQGSEGGTPFSAHPYESEIFSPRSPEQHHYQAGLYPSAPRDVAPLGQLPGAASAASPAYQEPHHHRRQRSNTFNLGDLSLGTDTDPMDGKEIPIPRQLQDPVEMFSTEKKLLIAAFKNFLEKTTREGKVAIEQFTASNAGDASPAEKRHDSTFKKLTKGLRSADKNAAESLAEKRKHLQELAEPYNKRFDELGAQCIIARKALEDATEKLTRNGAEGSQSK